MAIPIPDLTLSMEKDFIYFETPKSNCTALSTPECADQKYVAGSSSFTVSTEYTKKKGPIFEVTLVVVSTKFVTAG